MVRSRELICHIAASRSGSTVRLAASRIPARLVVDRGMAAPRMSWPRSVRDRGLPTRAPTAPHLRASAARRDTGGRPGPRAERTRCQSLNVMSCAFARPWSDVVEVDVIDGIADDGE